LWLSNHRGKEKLYGSQESSEKGSGKESRQASKESREEEITSSQACLITYPKFIVEI